MRRRKLVTNRTKSVRSGVNQVIYTDSQIWILTYVINRLTYTSIITLKSIFMILFMSNSKKVIRNEEQAELRNTAYTDTWLSDTKIHFSKPTCSAYNMVKNYMSGSPIRQEYLKTAIK